MSLIPLPPLPNSMRVVSNVLPDEDAASLFDSLLLTTPWTPCESSVASSVALPSHFVSAYGRHPLTYSSPHTLPREWTPLLHWARSTVEEHVRPSLPFNYAMVRMLRDTNDYIEWQWAGGGPCPPAHIGSSALLALGTARPLWLARSDGAAHLQFTAPPGSCLVMDDARLRPHWRYCLPRRITPPVGGPSIFVLFQSIGPLQA